MIKRLERYTVVTRVVEDETILDAPTRALEDDRCTTKRSFQGREDSVSKPNISESVVLIKTVGATSKFFLK